MAKDKNDSPTKRLSTLISVSTKTDKRNTRPDNKPKSPNVKALANTIDHQQKLKTKHVWNLHRVNK